MGEDKKNKPFFKVGKHTILLGLCIVIATIIIFFINSFTGGVNLTTDKKNKVSEYNTISAVKASSTLHLDFPPFVNEDDQVKAQDKYGLFVEIVSDNYVIKAGSFVDVEADPLALYVESEENTAYTCNISNDDYENLSFFRLRYGVDGLEHCTVINWVNGEVMYGMILPDVYSEDKVFTMFNISKDQLELYSSNGDVIAASDTDEEEDSSDDNSTDGTKTYNCANMYSIDIPKTVNEISQIDMEEKSFFRINDMIIFVFIYNDKDIQDGLYGGDGEKAFTVDGKNGVLRYQKNNPFEKGSTEFSDYEAIISNIDNIVMSIKPLNSTGDNTGGVADETEVETEVETGTVVEDIVKE